jgi:hypothetical protein
MAEIGWGDGAGAQRAVAVSSGSPSAPPWVPEPAHAFGAIEGRCAAACAPDLPAAIRLEGSWFSGEARAISAMATAFEGHESPSALLVDLARWADGADDGVVALKPAAVDLTVPCTEMAPVGGDAAPWLSGCFPARWAEEGQRLALRLDGLGIARVRPAASERFGFAYRLVAKDEANAEAVATALATFWSELVGTVDAGVVDLAKLAGKSSASKALFDTWLRAVRSARVERRGLTVDVVAETTLRDSERAELAAAGLPPDRSAALERVVDALAAGSALAAPDLAPFLGHETSEWLLSPVPSSADCAAVVAKAQSFASADLADADVVTLGSLFAQWAPDRCSDRVLPAPVKQCLSSAASLGAMAACSVPRSPDARALLASLEGMWTGVAVEELNPVAAARALTTAKKTTLELHDGNAIYAVDGNVGKGRVLVVAAGDERSTLRLPTGPQPATTCVGTDDFGDPVVVPNCTRRPAASVGAVNVVIELRGPNRLRMRPHDEKGWTVLARKGAEAETGPRDDPHILREEQGLGRGTPRRRRGL